MSVRIRKLAKELNRSPSEVIGVLHALGFQRYRSAEDMLSDVVEARLRKGIQSGVTPLHVEIDEPSVPQVSHETLTSVAANVDLMAALVPGVVPQGRGRPPAPRPARPAPPPPALAPAPLRRPDLAPPAPVISAPLVDEVGLGRAMGAERAALESLRRSLDSERSVLAAERASVDDLARRVSARERSLESQQRSLQELQDALDHERDALTAERAALASHLGRASAERTRGLEDLLEARGLRGADEFERALVALAQGRHLREVLWTLKVDSAGQLERLLTDRLALVGTDPPESVLRSAAAVAVAPERAEVPDASALVKAVRQLSDRLLLHGFRRVAIVGGRPLWQRLVREYLDARIEARFVAGKRGRSGATDDVAWADVVLLWAADLDDGALPIYEAGRPRVVKLQRPTLTGFLQEVYDALAD